MVELGDVWQLGPHRIACGDSTNVATVSKLLGSETPLLMVTDPPYGVNYDANWRNERLAESGSRSTGEVLNDDRADWTEAWNLFPGSICYVWTASLSSPIVYESLKQSAFEIRSQIVWTKPGLIVGRGNYHWQHEPALVGVRGDQTIEPDGECETGWYAVKQKAKALFVGGRKQSTVWQAWFSQSDAKTPHSTQKPVALFARAMINHGSVGDAVYDPFLGSGTSIVAAHRTGRRCFGLELNPLYCEIIIKRFEALTGIKAIKLNDKTS
jgi:DNA modification methylase